MARHECYQKMQHKVNELDGKIFSSLQEQENSSWFHQKRKKNVFFSNIVRYLNILTSSMLAMSSQTGVNVIKPFFSAIELDAK
jgi:hypothetical protein